MTSLTKLILVITLLNSFFSQTQSFMSKCDQHDLKEIQEAFSKTIIDTAKLNKFSIHKDASKYYLSLIAKTNKSFDSNQIENLGGKARRTIDNITTIKIPLSSIKHIAELENIEYASIAKKFQPSLDKALIDTHADSVHRGLGGLAEGYDGENVLIGVTDWGFDYTSPVFYDSLLQETRILAAWDQYKLSGPSPENFNYGTEFNTPNELINAGSDTANIYSYSTHGTHVASIAGGSAVGTSFKGIAPGAQFLFVTFLVDESAVLDAWEWMYQKSLEEGKRLVINMSWGLYHFGSLDGNSILSTAIAAYTDLGVVFVNSAGNNGNVNFHLKHEFNNDTIATRIQFYSYASNPNMWGQSIHSWGTAGNSFSNKLQIKNTAGQIVAESPFYNTENVNAYIDSMLIIDQDTIWYNISAENAHPLNGRPQMRLRVKCTSSAYRVMLNAFATAGIVHNWNVTELTNDVGNWGMPFSAYGTGTLNGDKQNGISEPSCADDVISVAAYASGWVTPTGITTGGAIASFSSQGPRYDGEMKPDIAAPGVSVGAAISSYTDASFSSIESIEFNTRTYHFARLSGTSMAAPMVSGIAALLLDAKPELSARDLKELLLLTAREDNKTGQLPMDGDPKWGHGKIDAMAAIREALNLELPSELQIKTHLHVYPNPVNEVLAIELMDEINKDGFLTDFSGKQYPIQIVNGKVDCIHIQPGMYSLTFYYEGQRQQITFVKQ